MAAKYLSDDFVNAVVQAAMLH